MALGTFNSPARLYRLNDACVRLVLREPASFRWNQPLIVTGHGGSTPRAWGRALWGGRTSGDLRTRIADFAAGYDALDLPGYPRFHLDIFGYARSSGDDGYAGARKIGKWILRDSLVEKIKGAVRSASERPGGTTLPELSGGIPGLKGLETPLLEAVVGEMKAEGALVERKGVLFPPGRERGEVSAAGKKILEAAAGKEPEALELKDISLSGAQQEVRTLVREDLLVQLEGGLYYRPEAYSDLKNTILDGLPPGASFTIPDAKDRTGLSRKYIIPLLNRMEADKLVRRDENQRIVL